MGWGSQNGDGSFDLVEIVVSWEEGSSAQKFGKNAADTPHVQSVSVVACVQDDLWGPVPPRNYVLSKSRGRLLIPSSQTKIANF